MKINNAPTQPDTATIAKNAAPEKRGNFEDSLNNFQALLASQGQFAATAERAGTIISLEDWHAELAFQLNSVGMSNPALTNNYNNARQALTNFNELWIGNGTRMTLNNGHSLMFDGIQAFMLRNGRGLELQDRAYRQPDLTAIREIAHFANRLRHYADGTLPGGRFGNGFPDAAAHLRAMGIDPRNDFTINGVRVRLEDGEIRRMEA